MKRSLFPGGRTNVPFTLRTNFVFTVTCFCLSYSVQRSHRFSIDVHALTKQRGSCYQDSLDEKNCENDGSRPWVQCPPLEDSDRVFFLRLNFLIFSECYFQGLSCKFVAGVAKSQCTRLAIDKLIQIVPRIRHNAILHSARSTASLMTSLLFRRFSNSLNALYFLS